MQDPNDTNFIVNKLNVNRIRNPIALAIYVYYKALYVDRQQPDTAFIKDHFNITETQYREALQYLKDGGVE